MRACIFCLAFDFDCFFFFELPGVFPRLPEAEPDDESDVESLPSESLGGPVTPPVLSLTGGALAAAGCAAACPAKAGNSCPGLLLECPPTGWVLREGCEY